MTMLTTNGMHSNSMHSKRRFSRWLAPVVLAAALGVGATTAPAPAQAQDNLTRVLVDIADVVFRSGTPYYRNGDYRNGDYRNGDYRDNDRLVVGRDRYGRTVYYRVVPRDYRDDSRERYRSGPPYGNAYGYYRNGPGSRNVKCNKHGKCKTKYYDSRYDRDHDRGHDRGWDGRRGRDDDEGRDYDD